MLRRGLVALCPVVALVSTPGWAQSETTTYSYDALGRLVGSSISNGPNNGVATTIGYDPAGNRTTYSVTGSPNGGGSDPGAGSSVPQRALFVVVPLNGFTLIPIR